MTLERLNRHARLRRELEKAEDLKASLEEAVDLKAQVLTRMPHAPGYQNKLGVLIPMMMDGVAAASTEIRFSRKRQTEPSHKRMKRPSPVANTDWQLYFTTGEGA